MHPLDVTHFTFRTVKTFLLTVIKVATVLPKYKWSKSYFLSLFTERTKNYSDWTNATGHRTVKRCHGVHQINRRIYTLFFCPWHRALLQTNHQCFCFPTFGSEQPHFSSPCLYSLAPKWLWSLIGGSMFLRNVDIPHASNSTQCHSQVRPQSKHLSLYD
jgi:hypothetical protein